MSGYTPLFSSLIAGTLCGRWPDIGLWPIVLSLSDRNGVVDVTPQYISSVTGLGLEEVIACMRRFCEPDACSRSPVDDGRRLVRLDNHRDWGWRIVNHALYRERARKAAYDAERTASGKDAQRKRVSRGVPRCPAVSGGVPRSPALQTQTQTQTKTQEQEAPAAPGLDAEAWEKWLEYRKKRKPAIKPESMAAAQRELAAFGDQQAIVVDHSIANGYQGLFEPKRANGAAPPKRTWRPGPEDCDEAR